jgi:DNA-binding protein HU-beta
MTKEELVDKIAKEATVTKAQASKAVAAFFNGVTTALKKGGKVSFVGFGTFSVAKRKARMGRNPQTGAPIKIAASRVPKFKAGKQLKDAVKSVK